MFGGSDQYVNALVVDYVVGKVDGLSNGTIVWNATEHIESR